MSLYRIIRHISDRESGLISRYRLSYQYRLISNVAAGYKRLYKQLYKNPVWTEDVIKNRFPVQTDRLDRQYLINFSKSVLCKDPDKESTYPLVEKKDKDPFFTVPLSECKKCQHFIHIHCRNRSICKLHRDLNKGLLANTIKSSMENVNRIMGTKVFAAVEERDHAK